MQKIEPSNIEGASVGSTERWKIRVVRLIYSFCEYDKRNNVHVLRLVLNQQTTGSKSI